MSSPASASLFRTTSRAAIFSDTNSTLFPAFSSAPIMFAMVCDLPVPGGPSMTNVLPAKAAATAARCEESASNTSGVSSGGATLSMSAASMGSNWNCAVCLLGSEVARALTIGWSRIVDSLSF